VSAQCRDLHASHLQRMLREFQEIRANRERPGIFVRSEGTQDIPVNVGGEALAITQSLPSDVRDGFARHQEPHASISQGEPLGREEHILRYVLYELRPSPFVLLSLLVRQQ